MIAEHKLPEISVIVPVYKVEPFIHQCVDSILNQSFQNFELILIDDGSPDSCGMVCDLYAQKDPRVRVIHQKNAGLSAARNAGLEVMRGNYVSFVDSDDYISEEYLEVLFSTIKETDADVSMCGFFRAKDGESATQNKYSCTEIKTVLSGRELSFLRYKNKIDVAAWAKLYARCLFCDIRFPVGKVFEDQAVVPRIFYTADKIALIDSCHYYYRIRTDSISHSTFNLSRFDNIIHMNEFISMLKRKKEKELCKLAIKHRNETLANYTIQAKKAGITQVPKGCYMSEIRAFYILRKLLPDDKYSWHLACLHPRWVKPHAYIRKLESILTGKPL